ncbi:MAG: PEP-CTERM sorting domain-containing protein [Gallionellaceae bacterium]|nr:PEP-CTERM sorting domain-containing protein [Gallionellaceae bacterium]MDD5365156.1 PEP-CTERM sorting domain-containing protein [Gallionellaceae bacterium]
MISNKVQSKTSGARMLLGALAMAVGMPSAFASVTTYNVVETFNQVVYDVSNPTWDTIFTGSFSYDSVTQTVSNLTGSLSQAMDGNTTWVPLTYQLSAVADGTNGLIVSVFKENTTDVFQGGGFASTGLMGPVRTYGNYNAFASIYVPFADPTAALTQAEMDKLAYADCTPGGLMPRNGSGTVCMAGWVAYANGVPGPGGTMRGTFPITQSITAAVPEPETYALMSAGLGLMGFVARRRRKTR